MDQSFKFENLRIDRKQNAGARIIINNLIQKLNDGEQISSENCATLYQHFINSVDDSNIDLILKIIDHHDDFSPGIDNRILNIIIESNDILEKYISIIKNKTPSLVAFQLKTFDLIILMIESNDIFKREHGIQLINLFMENRTVAENGCLPKLINVLLKYKLFDILKRLCSEPRSVYIIHIFSYYDNLYLTTDSKEFSANGIIQLIKNEPIVVEIINSSFNTHPPTMGSFGRTGRTS